MLFMLFARVSYINNRYKTPAIDSMLKRLTVCEERRDKALRDTMENLFCSFDRQ